MIYMRRLLKRFERDIAAAHPSDADRLRADRIGYLAGYGLVDEARAELAALRSRYDASPHPTISPQIIFADALVDRATALHDVSLIKMRRAHALSLTEDLAGLRALSAAWLAHIYWNLQDVDLTIRFASEALRLATSVHHAALIRVSLVVGEGLLLSRQEALGQLWYVKARNLSQQLGDEPSSSALIFNLASVRLMLMRQAILSEDKPAPSAFLAVAIHTSESFDHAMGIRIDARTPLQQAKIHSLQGDACKSLNLYLEHARNPTLLATQRERSEWLADEAWCLARLGHLEEAELAAVGALDAVVPGTHIDDLASIHSRVSRTYRLVGDEYKASLHQDLADTQWKKYRSFQAEFGLRFTELAKQSVAEN